MPPDLVYGVRFLEGVSEKVVALGFGGGWAADRDSGIDELLLRHFGIVAN